MKLPWVIAADKGMLHVAAKALVDPAPVSFPPYSPHLQVLPAPQSSPFWSLAAPFFPIVQAVNLGVISDSSLSLTYYIQSISNSIPKMYPESNLTSPHLTTHLPHYYPKLSCHRLSPGVLQQPPLWSPYLPLASTAHLYPAARGTL